MTVVPHRLWQLAGALCLAHIVLSMVGLVLQQGPLFADGTAGIRDHYVEGDLARTFTGGVVGAVGFLLMLPVVVFLGRILGRRSEGGAWAAQTGVVCGLAFVVVTFAVGFPAGGAAMYGAQHGLDLETAFALNNVRIFGYFLSLLLLGASTLGFAVAALADRVHPTWFGHVGVVTGVALLAGTPLASVGHEEWGTLLWMVWFVGVGVLMLRHRDEALTPDPESAPRDLAVGHS